MSQRVTLVAVTENPDGSLTIQDANGNPHAAANAQSLWVALKQILADPELPNVEEGNPDEFQFEEMLRDFIKAQLPAGLDRAAKPFVRSGLGFLQRLSRRDHHSGR